MRYTFTRPDAIPMGRIIPVWYCRACQCETAPVDVKYGDFDQYDAYTGCEDCRQDKLHYETRPMVYRRTR